MSAETRGAARRAMSLRGQIVLIVVGLVIVPLALVGLWITRSVMMSGEALLRSHLEASADGFVKATTSRWQYRRSDVLYLAQNTSAERMVRGEANAADTAFLNALAADVGAYIPQAALRDRTGATRWSSIAGALSAQQSRGAGAMPKSPAVAPAGPAIRMEVPVGDTAGHSEGTAVISVAVAGLVPPDSARPLVPGSELAIRDGNSGNVPVPLSRSVQFPSAPSFVMGAQRWLVVYRHLHEPSIDIAIAAPLGPYVGPFQHAAVTGLAAIIVTSALAILLLLWLTHRMLRPLEALARASDAIAAGRMDQQVHVRGPREIQRVGSTFNLMTRSLRDTLESLSRRTALAAVGGFATSLSHDVRNALTSIKVDLERLASRELPDATSRGLVRRSLNSVERLEASVAGALRVARRGSTPLSMVNVADTIRRAAGRVEGTMASIPATLELELPAARVDVMGAAAALEQLFANLLFNAAQALVAGGLTRVTLTALATGARVTIQDSGEGMTQHALRALDTPFYSSRPNGTGLGLPIARQIAAAHGGTLTIESKAGRGTCVTVLLPSGTERSDELNEAISSAAAWVPPALDATHGTTTV